MRRTIGRKEPECEHRGVSSWTSGKASERKRIEMKNLVIANEFLNAEETTAESSFCLVAHNDHVESLLAEIYGRRELCLKIFKGPPGNKTISTFKWGGATLKGCVIIQNLFAQSGLAPRVFDVVQVNDLFAQVTPFLPQGKQPSSTRVAQLRFLTESYKLGTWRNYWDVKPSNWRSALFVDFSGFYFTDPQAYEADLVRQAHTRRGEYIGVAYQPVSELGIKGTRDMNSRVNAMRLDEIDFAGKAVLDIGCNLGYLCRLSSERGARRVVGVDRIAGLTYQMANWLGDWETDYLQLRLPEEAGEIFFSSGIEKFDIVIATAVVKHIGGLAPWLRELCKDLFIFEGHGSIDAEVYEPQLAQFFKEVNYLGQTNDNYKRHLFQCRV